jgi:hypothetical protein
VLTHQEIFMHRSEFAASLTYAGRRRLVLAITTGLHETRLAAEVLRNNGDVDELRQRLATAGVWIRDALADLDRERSDSGL